MKSKPALFILIVITIFISFSVVNSQCSCLYVTPDSKYVEIVFTGKILNISEADKYNKYQIQISEVFKGLDEQKSIEIFDSFYNCNSRRYVNKEYLFMAFKEKATGRIEVVGCSYSYGNKYKQQQFIEILRLKKSSQNQGGVLVGKVTGKIDDEGNSFKPDGVDKVFIESENGEKFEANIDADGFYKLTNLSEGNYKVYIKLPDGLTTYGDANGFDWESSERTNVKISKNKGVIQDFSVITNGIISGKVLDSNGFTVVSITVNLIGSDGYVDDSTETDQNGYYEFKGISPAEYLIKVGSEDSYVSPNSKEVIYPNTFYPSTDSQKNAEVIQLKQSEVLKNRNITLLPILKKRIVTGQVFMPNGQPAANANVSVQIKRKDGGKILTSGWHGMTETDVNGNFSLDVYEDTEYLVKFYISKPTGEVTVEVLFSIECFALPAKGIIKPLKIVLKKGDIECNEEKFGF